MSAFRIAVRAVIPAACLWAGLMQAYGSVVCGPMLQGASTSNIYVLVECTLGVASPMTVNYGTTTAYGGSASSSSTKSTSASPVTYVHRIKLTGLQPNTLYHYQLINQGASPTDYTFRTLANSGTPFRWIWSADYRTGIAVHDQIAYRILNAHNTPTPPLFDVGAGDFASDNNYGSWTNQWLSTNEKELEKWICSYLSPGNHDGSGSTWGTNMQAFQQPTDSAGSTGYYSLDCGDLHVTVANYMDPSGYAVNSAQYNWIQQDVQSSLKPWKVFVAHAPAYTWGGSGAHTGDAGYQTIASNILQTNDVKVCLAGHNHFYQHNLVNGVHHITCGAAGAPLYAVSSHATYTIKSFSSNCYLVADVSATNLHMVAYDNLGNTLETIDLAKPPAPTNLVATAGNSQVILNWNAVNGATNYTVRYGTNDGGPYSVTRTTTAASLTAVGLTNGTTYYFVVNASDTNGPSALSSQVTGTPLNPPVVTLTAPTSGSSFVGPATITLAATVIDNGYPINKVQFDDGPILLDEGTSAPYGGTWSNPTAGPHTLTAVALYGGGNAVTSTPVTITVYADSVGDGIPDWWRTQHFGGDGTTTNIPGSCALCDPDGDGMSNLKEYLAGTDPTDGTSVFSILGVDRQGIDLRITWATTPGKSYALQAADDLLSGFDDIFAVTNTTGSVTNYLNIGGATNNPAHFYRVRLVP